MNEDEYYSNDGGMVSDSALRKRKSDKTKIPNFRPIVRKKVPRTEFGEVMGNLTFGMLFIFPLIAFLTMSFPLEVISIIGVIALVIWGMSQRFSNAIIFIGICIGIELLGFLSIGILMAILG
ncbi:hypothetical protein [Cytobacillus oceanisediminis]|uniref:hypothetical protein n=1 Tax=Cytobacillus oceanisediminis TaxID=665099 RepID=UPI00203F16DC|nr:hypothetical protein [Cytobacillus oceanisediminis]MCM3394870.1 hypothetical protein [Cytobacillus oceanisediminis]